MVERIIARTVDAYEPGRFWPRHELDEHDSPSGRDKGLWIGAAGVLWALDRLGAGIGEADVYDAYVKDPDFPGSTGLMMGELGVVLVSWKLAPTAVKEERIAELVQANMHNVSHELFNGAPGAMLAALHTCTRPPRMVAGAISGCSAPRRCGSSFASILSSATVSGFSIAAVGCCAASVLDTASRPTCGRCFAVRPCSPRRAPWS